VPSEHRVARLKAPADRHSYEAQAAYRTFFSGLLAQQLRGHIDAMVEAKIHEISLTFEPIRRDVFKIFVPGIREDSPKLAIGDRMMFRPLNPQCHVALPFSVEGEVMGLEKLKGGVYVKSEMLASLDSYVPPDTRGNKKYQVEFKTSTDAVCDMQDAVSCWFSYSTPLC
jgi:hypothetical protein